MVAVTNLLGSLLASRLGNIRQQMFLGVRRLRSLSEFIPWIEVRGGSAEMYIRRNPEYSFRCIVFKHARPPSSPASFHSSQSLGRDTLLCKAEYVLIIFPSHPASATILTIIDHVDQTLARYTPKPTLPTWSSASAPRPLARSLRFPTRRSECPLQPPQQSRST